MWLLVYCIIFVINYSLVVSNGTSSVVPPNIDESVLEKLKNLIQDDQVKKTTEFKYPFSMYKQKGTYSSYIHMNYAGGLKEQVLRNFIKFYDVNAFVTLWVGSILLEVARLNETIEGLDNQLTMAIDAISTFHDKNERRNSSLMVFWPQSYNQSTGTWTCSPTNLESIVKEDERLADYVHKILDDLGLSSLWNKIAPIIYTYTALTRAFYIPEDFDDTFVNLGFGSLLKAHSNSTPYKTWSLHNKNISGVLAALRKIAYRPFDQKFDSNTIDPRTYFYLRDFIYEAQSHNQTLALVPTWIMSITQDRYMYDKYVNMPFNVNNVDITVSVNTLYGLTAAILNGLITVEMFDEDIQAIYENTTSLLVWEVGHNFSSRPDLALTYYPSVYNYFWFMSRVLNMLNAHADDLPLPVLKRVREMLMESMQGNVTEYLLKRAIADEKYVYFDDFLGNNDKDTFGKSINHAEDRICSTAMATNTLLYIWTTSNSNSWAPNTPSKVQQTVAGTCRWLNDHAVSNKYKPMNAFFSGSIKSTNDFGFFYPLNVVEFINGTKIRPDYQFTVDSGKVLGGVSGIIEKSEYAKMLTEKHFGQYTSLDFHGLNNDSFPFWSSDPLTYSTTLLALVQCKHAKLWEKY